MALRQPHLSRAGARGRSALRLLRSADTQTTPQQAKRLWLAIELPHFALDCRRRSLNNSPALLLADHTGPVSRVHDADATLLAEGIQAGQRLSAALALGSELRVLDYDAQREQKDLAALGQWALRFSSQVVLNPPHGLLLEVGGSLRLFGGHTALRRQVEAGLRGLGLRAHLATAPTPLAANWLAASGQNSDLLTNAALHQEISTLPFTVAIDSVRDRKRLQGLGVRSIADLLRLPREGLNRRLSRELGLRLDRAFGKQPDPRQPIRPQPHFDADLLLPDEIHHAPLITIACDRLLQQLQGFLRGCQLTTQRLVWHLHHHKEAPTLLVLGTDSPTQDPARWQRVLDERLNALQLPAPVVRVQLRVERLLSFSTHSASLFDEPDGLDSDDSAQLLERLRARFGEQAINGLEIEPAHTPEANWRFTAPAPDSEHRPPPSPRPLWLLPQPHPLPLHHQRPWLDGPLHLGPETERLESGWWTDQPISRDYFNAHDDHGRWLWVYRDRKSGGWFLHGWFD